MFFNKNKMKVVPAGEFTDYSERFEDLEKMRAEQGYATKKDVVVMASIPVLGAAGYAMYQSANKASEVVETAPISEPINVLQHAPFPEPSTLTEAYTPLVVNATSSNLNVIPTGIIEDKTLEMLSAIFDPFIQILVAISFPVASMIMAVSFFIMMFGMKEKALSLMMNAGIGYVLVQMLPLFNSLLKTVGDAV